MSMKWTKSRATTSKSLNSRVGTKWISNSEPPSECPQTHTHYEEFKSAATGKTRYRKFSHLPQAFVEMSPALIGGGKSREGAARVLGYTDLETDAPFFLSSPKRYVWDE